jgi:hypothetical protein
VERRGREWDEYVKRMNAGRLVKISRENAIYLPEDLQDVRKENGVT